MGLVFLFWKGSLLNLAKTNWSTSQKANLKPFCFCEIPLHENLYESSSFRLNPYKSYQKSHFKTKNLYIQRTYNRWNRQNLPHFLYIRCMYKKKWLSTREIPILWGTTLAWVSFPLMLCLEDFVHTLYIRRVHTAYVQHSITIRFIDALYSWGLGQRPKKMKNQEKYKKPNLEYQHSEYSHALLAKRMEN